MAQTEVVRIEPHEQVVLARVLPRALNEVATAQLEDEVSRAAAGAPGLPVVLDMANVNFVPSVALGAIVNLRKGLRFEGRSLILVNVSRQLRGVINVTRLDQVLDIYNTLDEALARLGQKRPTD